MNPTYVFELRPLGDHDAPISEPEQGENHGFGPTAARQLPCSLREHMVDTLLPAVEEMDGVGVYTTARSDLLPGELSLHTERVASSIGASTSEEDEGQLVRRLLVLAHRVACDVCDDCDVCESPNSMPGSSGRAHMIVVVFVCAEGSVQYVVVYTSTMPVSVPPLIAPPGKLHVARVIGPPRCRPDVKDIAWIRDRKRLEVQTREEMRDLPDQTCCDTLLCKENGELLEGLITNLFIVVEASDGGVGSRYTLQTAPASTVLAGVARGKVIEACRRLGISVDLTGPKPEERHRWAGAFLTNSIRQVQILDGIVCSPSNVWGLEAWEAFFDQHEGDKENAARSIIDHIAKHIT